MLDYKSINNKYQNTRDYVNFECTREIGNYVVYTQTNGLNRNPICFGDSIYLYSIEKNKSQMIWGGKNPFISKRDATICNNLLFCMDCDIFGDSTGELNIKNLDSGKKKKYYVGWDYAYKDGIVYGIDDIEGLFSINLKTEEKDVVIEGIEELTCCSHSYFDLYEDWIICYDYANNNFVVYSIETKKTSIIEWGKGAIPICCEVNAEGKLTVLYDHVNKWIEYDLNTDDKKTIGTIKKNELKQPKWFAHSMGIVNSMKTIDNYIYFVDVDGNVYVYDKNKSKLRRIIDISKYTKDYDKSMNVANLHIGYTEDYIVIDMVYSYDHSENYENEKYSHELMLFSYEGELHKNKNLAVWFNKYW